jgi:uncharacterized protein (DUF1810 family)
MYVPFDLDRFLDAQASAYTDALSELKAGRKRSHWMWFIFPQMAGLGHSAMARFYGIESFAEAKAYLDHEILGARLLECTQAALDANAPSLAAYLGSPDDLKFRSCMTLFCAVDPHPNSVFKWALDRWCDGQSDRATLDLLAGSTPK